MNIPFLFIFTYALSLASMAACRPNGEPNNVDSKVNNLVARGCGSYYWSIDHCERDNCPGKCIAIMANAECSCDGYDSDTD
ncbi:hypothetical protein F5X99DRAFT_401006 [Biscogniauxia marginata]|nr:hypothetical protein F5X99DRAFT_401006 [Biscogniauxia marginata]